MALKLDEKEVMINQVNCIGKVNANDAACALFVKALCNHFIKHKVVCLGWSAREETMMSWGR